MNTQKQISLRKRAILYLRFSDNKQKGGTSIEVQEEQGISSCKAQGFDVVDIIKDEAVSADSKKPTQRVAHLLEFCRARKGNF
jgi:DNA invertase Pin-like site-specific DNA recombinase